MGEDNRIPQVIINNDGYNKEDVPHLQELHSKVKEWQPQTHEPSILKEVKEAKNIYGVISRGRKIKGYFDKMQNNIGEDEVSASEDADTVTEVASDLAETGEVLEDLIPLLLL
jgi:hypothetical protein